MDGAGWVGGYVLGWKRRKDRETSVVAEFCGGGRLVGRGVYKRRNEWPGAMHRMKLPEMSGQERCIE